MERERLATLAELIEICVKNHGCRLLKLEPDPSGPRGPEESWYLTRTNGGLRNAMLPSIDRDKPLPARVIRSICSRLGIPAFEFGLFVG